MSNSDTFLDLKTIIIELDHKKKCKHCGKFNTYKIPTVYLKEKDYLKIIEYLKTFLESAMKK